jgi:hypothetical protein
MMTLKLQEIISLNPTQILKDPQFETRSRAAPSCIPSARAVAIPAVGISNFIVERSSTIDVSGSIIVIML